MSALHKLSSKLVKKLFVQSEKSAKQLIKICSKVLKNYFNKSKDSQRVCFLGKKLKICQVCVGTVFNHTGIEQTYASTNFSFDIFHSVQI